MSPTATVVTDGSMKTSMTTPGVGIVTMGDALGVGVGEAAPIFTVAPVLLLV